MSHNSVLRSDGDCSTIEWYKGASYEVARSRWMVASLGGRKKWVSYTHMKIDKYLLK